MGAKSGRNKRGGRGRPKRSGAPQTGRGGGASRAQRVGLVLFAVVFVALFVIFAVAQGLGAPSVPKGDVAKVTNVAADKGVFSMADYKRSVEQQEAQQGLKKPPKAGSKKAEELRKSAVGEMLNAAWIFGEGEELGIEVTPKEVETELKKIKKESFKTEKAFQEFMKESHFTEEDVNSKIELQILSRKIEEKIKGETPALSEEELKAYYEKEKATQFTKKPSRDVRVVVNENKKEVEAAQKALEADNSEASWKKVTKKYSPTTAAQAGLQKEISEEFLTEPLKKDIFGAATGELIGPVKQEKNYLLLEVVTLHPEKVQTFDEVKTTIEGTLKAQKEEKFFSSWVAGFQAKWISRSYCASGFVIEQCANYKGTGHPAEAPEACYEANPKTPAKECPAPVVQTKPALPGTVSLALPEGEPKVQRPRPEEASKSGEEGAEGAAGGEGSAETEASQKAAEEAAAKPAEEAASKGGGKSSGKGE
ncbi:MAG TPA: peptidyl-prolyl cis-trans isomerase [Solirubrobacterales bacterium]|nr:peptidyl-prolyl cis-trans isomerase [Solirubrobacterales bacterium]